MSQDWRKKPYFSGTCPETLDPHRPYQLLRVSNEKDFKQFFFAALRDLTAL